MDVSPGKESHPTLKHCLGQQVCRVSTAQPLGSSTTDGLSPFSKQEREREREITREKERKKERHGELEGSKDHVQHPESENGERARDKGAKQKRFPCKFKSLGHKPPSRCLTPVVVWLHHATAPTRVRGSAGLVPAAGKAT